LEVSKTELDGRNMMAQQCHAWQPADVFFAARKPLKQSPCRAFRGLALRYNPLI
jgi:hypothetical protein